MASSHSHPVRVHISRGLSYSEAEAWQKRLVSAMAEDATAPGTVLFVEHSPVITCGRSGDGGNLLVTAEQLAAQGIAFHQSGRGGDVTYHGPGQWTVYPILRLDWYERNLHRYLRLLEECVITFLAGFRVSGARRPGLTGVWLENAKIAAVGIAVTRWITWHGFALNIDPELSRFTTLMHPCGIAATQGSVTSLSQATQSAYTLDETLLPLQAAMSSVLNLIFVE